MRNLEVKYKSQWDNDAGKTKNDCGPASIAMILNYYGESLTTDTVFEKTEADQGLIGWDELQKAIKSFGYIPHLERNATPERIRELIDQNLPPIVLVHYGSLNSTQDKKFKGGHFFLVVGYREDGYFVNDPNFRDALRQDGDHHFYTKEEFESAWAETLQDKNQPHSLLWIERKAADPATGELAKCQDQLGILRRTIEDMKKDWSGDKKALENLKKDFKTLEITNQGLRTTNKQWQQFLDNAWDLLKPQPDAGEKNSQTVIGEIKKLILQEDQLDTDTEKTKQFKAQYANLIGKVGSMIAYTGTDEKELLRRLHEVLSSENTPEEPTEDPKPATNKPKKTFWQWLKDRIFVRGGE